MNKTVQLILATAAWIISVQSVFAQKFKHDNISFKAQHYPVTPLNGDISRMSIVTNIINPNNQYKDPINADAMIAKIIKMDSITIGSTSSEYTIEFNLNTTPPLKSAMDATNVPTQYDYKSTYVLKDKKGFKFGEGTISYSLNGSFAEPFNTRSDASAARDIERQFRGLAQIIKSKYDFINSSEMIRMCRIKDDNYKEMGTLNDSLEAWLGKVVIPFDKTKDPGIIKKAIDYNQNLINTTDKANEKLENVIFAAHSNLINLYTLMGDLQTTGTYTAYVEGSDHGGVGKGNAVAYYKKRQYEQENFKSKKEGTAVTETKPGLLSVLTPKDENASGAYLKKGFIIRAAGTDTVCGKFAGNEKPEISRAVIFGADKEGAVKETIKSEDLSYFFVDGLLYKSLKPETDSKTIIGGPDAAAWKNRNSFAVVYYESDLIFFGVVEKGDQKRYYLMNKTTAEREECAMPVKTETKTQLVTGNQIRKMFKACFKSDDRLEKFLETYEFNDKSAKEIFDVISKVEEFYGKGQAEYTRVLTKLAALSKGNTCK